MIRSRRRRSSQSDEDEGAGREGELDAETGRAVVVVSGLDAQGVPLASLRGGAAAATREDLRGGGARMRGKRRLHGLERDGAGNVTSYGPADEGVSLQELVAREKAGGGAGADAALAKSLLRMGGSLKSGALGGSRAGADEGEEVDARLFRTEEDRLTAAARRERDLQRTAAADAVASREDATDPLNPAGPRFPRHLLVAAGKHWAVVATPGRALHPLHCVMVPLAAVESVVAADEEVYAESNAWRAALHSAFTTPLPAGSAGRAREDAAAAAAGDDEGWVPEPPVFCETVLDARPGRGRRTRVDVVPVPAEAAADAAVFFSNALREAEEETSSAPVIDTAGRGLRRCVPRGFAYSHAAWAGGGFVHPIESSATYPRDLLLDVAAGLTGAPPSRFGRREMSRPEVEARAAARELAQRLLARGAACVDVKVSASLGAAISRLGGDKP